MTRLPEFRPQPQIDVAATRGAIREDIAYRQDKAAWASWDLYLAAKGAFVSSLILEAFQTDYQRTEKLYEGLPHEQSHDVISQMAAAPFDWKAVGVAAGAYAITSAAGRIRHANAVDRDVARLAQAVHGGAYFAPHTPAQQRRERFMRRAKRGVATAVASVVGYKVGEQLPQMTDVEASLGLVGVAMTSIPLAKAYTKHQVRKIQEGIQGSNSTDAGSTPTRVPESHHLTGTEDTAILEPSSARYDWWNA